MKKQIKKLSKIKIALLTMALLLGGFWIVKSMMVSPQVALIANGGDQAAICTSNIDSFVATDSCGVGMVNRVDYTCLDTSKKGYEGGSTGDCIDPYVAYAHATVYCGQTCTNPTATPTPTCVPNPCPADGRTCKLMALPEGQSYCAFSPLPSPTKTDLPYPTPRPSYPGESSGPVPTPYPTRIPIPSPVFSSKPTPTPTSTPTPTPTASMSPKASPVVTPIVITKRTFLECYKSCRSNTLGAMRCLRSCMR